MSTDQDLVKDFIDESKKLIDECMDLLEELEQKPQQYKSLDVYGNKMDRIMGTSDNIKFLFPEKTAFSLITDYTKICKRVAYNTTMISNNLSFVTTVISFLMDATETLALLIRKCEATAEEAKSQINPAFIERLKWLSGKFKEDYKGSVGLGRDAMNQDSINDLLKKMGL